MNGFVRSARFAVRKNALNSNFRVVRVNLAPLRAFVRALHSVSREVAAADGLKV